MKVDNAVIMAAGTSSRFAPLSFETHKALIKVKGEVLIERQIKQLQNAGIPEIIIVTGYKAEQFKYLENKYGVSIIHNPDYLTRNNNASIYAVRNYLKNTYVCSADNYFAVNPFETVVDDSYYAALYANGNTNEWCMTEDADGYINSVSVGGSNAWYMLGQTFWSKEFSKRFVKILLDEYEKPETANKLWENIFMEHLDELKMKIRKYPDDSIFEFDSLDELRKFDSSYIDDTRSGIIKDIAKQLNVGERDITGIIPEKSKNFSASGIEFYCCGVRFAYKYSKRKVEKIDNE